MVPVPANARHTTQVVRRTPRSAISSKSYTGADVLVCEMPNTGASDIGPPFTVNQRVLVFCRG
ncbi:hypothetical protein CA85_40540 [Allorhodopirellula solitaria]|uniref:Uncharacterized protein n=1 Tax=Allorhodopirellula solitaria TaxID=2527987 RepID=A0A5C5X2N7_9BACT|nr:hypothetical protein CA85_40540 [Allorhodopirellula solitaria]